MAHVMLKQVAKLSLVVATLKKSEPYPRCSARMPQISQGSGGAHQYTGGYHGCWQQEVVVAMYRNVSLCS